MRSKASIGDRSTSELSRGDAETLLAELSTLRYGTRQMWSSPWFALVCFGSVTVLAAAALVVAGGLGLVITWVVAGVVGLSLVSRHYRRQGERSGVSGSAPQARRWSLLAFVACFIAAFAASAQVHARDAGIVASVLVVLAAYLALGIWQRKLEAPVAAAAAAFAPLILAALATRPWLVELSFGLSLIAAGAGLRMTAGRP